MMAASLQLRVSGCAVTLLPASILVSCSLSGPCSSICCTVQHNIDVALSLSCPDTMMWETCPDFTPNELNSPLTCPSPRAGACAAVVGTRMYLWSGRDGYKKIWNQQVEQELSFISF